jgi:AcrR family transcriptional regulator
MTNGQHAMTPEGTRNRLLDAALVLFADRGFRGATVGDIEAAAGLTPRGGAFYKHFSSKREILDAAFERYLMDLGASEAVVELMPLGDSRAELTLLVRWALQQLKALRPLMKIVHRDAGEFPELVERYRRLIANRGYVLASSWLQHKIKDAGMPEQDCDAIAAVALGAIVHYRIEETFLGAPPLDIDEERFVQTFLALWGPFEDTLLGKDRPQETPR